MPHAAPNLPESAGICENDGLEKRTTDPAAALISVVVPVYNAADVLAGCLDGLEGQSARSAIASAATSAFGSAVAPGACR